MAARTVLFTSVLSAVIAGSCGAASDQAVQPEAVVEAPEPTTQPSLTSTSTAPPVDPAPIDPGGNDGASGDANDPSCISDPSPVFTHAYTDLEQIDFISPTIVTSSNWLKNRQYHKVVTDADNNAPLVPVYAPADATATGITHYLGRMQLWDGTMLELAQFDVRFEVSCEVRFWFDHISELAEPFTSLASTDPALDTRDAEVPIDAAVEAGDLIGYTSGTEPAHTWDFIVVNRSVTNQFANQERYEQVSELVSLLHADCPFDYFEEPLRSQYRSLIGSWQGRTPGFDCNLEPDVPGTIAGAWFLTPFDPSLDVNRPDWGLVANLAADGSVDVNGPGATIRTLADAPTFADPTTVTTEHCFEDFNRPARHVYVELISDSELAAAFGDGACPAELPNTYEIFYR